MTYYSPQRILAVAPKVLGVDLNSLLVGDIRTEPFVRARRILFGVMRDISGRSFPEIAAAAGKKCHSSTYHRYGQWMCMDQVVRYEWIGRFRTALEADAGNELSTAKDRG